MRVIAGLYKGRTIKTVNNLSVRPATDRVKQTLFDMLASRVDWDDATVLDLFAGSGNLGIEALSRGAAHVTFVENSFDAARYIEMNVEMLGCADDTEILVMDAEDYLSRARGAYDVVFADPPYAYETTQDLPDLIFGRALVKPHGYLLIEHAPTLVFADTSLYRAGPVKKFGRTLVTFFQARGQNSSPSHTT